MKKFLSIMLVVLAGVTTHTSAMPIATAWQADALRYVENNAFGLGEYLEYKVGYQFITAGKAAFRVAPEAITYNGVQCYDIRFQVASLENLDWLYRVRDTYRTVMDINGIFPWRFEQHIREGNYSRDFEADLNQRTHVAKTTDGEFPLSPYVHDIVSAFYYIRTMNLQSKNKGDTIQLKNFYGKKVYDLTVRVLGRQTVEVEAGTFKCVVIEPLVTAGGLFKSEGKILIWMSDDERKIPVKVSTKILIGSIDAELSSYKGLRGPLLAKVK